jgi:hypothetical protein
MQRQRGRQNRLLTFAFPQFVFEWFDGAASAVKVIAAEDLAASGSSPPSFAVNITNVGSTTSDVSALAFLSDPTSLPLQEMFDFQRVAAVKPGETVTAYFVVPPSVAATVTEHGWRVLRPGTTLRIRIGDVPRHGHVWGDNGCQSGGAYVCGELRIGGEREAVVSKMPKRQ